MPGSPMEWYYLAADQTRGPVSEATLAALVRQGELGPETLVWHEGMPDWQPYAQVAGSPPPSAPEPAARAAAPVGTVIEPEVACSRCGEEVPANQLLTVGTMSLCPRCQQGYRRQVETGFGEGAGEMRYAHPLRRLAAFLLDGILCALGGAVILVAAGLLANELVADPALRGWILLAAVAGYGFWVVSYFVGRIARRGATVAMNWLRLEVVRGNGGRVGWWRAAGRLLVIVIVNGLTAGLGHGVALFDSRRRSLQDLVCGTVVLQR